MVIYNVYIFLVSRKFITVITTGQFQIGPYVKMYWSKIHHSHHYRAQFQTGPHRDNSTCISGKFITAITTGQFQIGPHRNNSTCISGKFITAITTGHSFRQDPTGTIQHVFLVENSLQPSLLGTVHGMKMYKMILLEYVVISVILWPSILLVEVTRENH